MFNYKLIRVSLNYIIMSYFKENDLKVILIIINIILSTRMLQPLLVDT